MMHWYAVRTRARAEKAVLDQLERKEIEAFLPTYTKWSRWKDRKKAIDWPIFPGYCFARFDPEHQLPVLKCVGVASIVSFGSELAAIPDIEIESLRTLAASQLKCDPVPLVKEGTLVRVVSGPLAGVVGTLLRKGTRARLVLSVDLIGRGVSAEVDAADIRVL
jgi:transcription termination/antitermination protein NusG